MSRLAAIAIGSLTGVLATLWWPASELPHVLQSWARLELGLQFGLLLVLALVFIWLTQRRRAGRQQNRRSHALPFVLLGIAFVLAVLLAAAQIQPALDARIHPEDSGETWRLRGTVATIPEPVAARSGEQAFRFELSVDQVERLASDPIQPRFSLQSVRLTLYTAAESEMNTSLLIPALGERWDVEARLYAPSGAVNPASFDYERWLFQRGLQATGTWAGGDRLSEAQGIARLRSHLYTALAEALPVGDARAVLQALVIGERGAFDDHLWESLRRTGTSHLVAISGLHVGLLAALAYFLSAWLWRRSARLCIWLAAPRAAALFALLAAALYAALAGFAIPTQRALWMLAVVLLAQFSRYRMQVMDVLAIALLGVLIVDVRAVLAIGFWLSFAAVALIAFFLQPPKLALSSKNAFASKSAWWRAITSAVRIQFGLALGMIPLLLLFFGQVSWASPWVNLLAVPVIGWIVVPLALIASALLLVLPTLGAWMLVWVERGLAHLLDGLHWVAGSDWAMSSPQHWSLLASLLLLFALGLSVWAWRQRHWRSALLAGLLLFVALLGREPATLAPNTLLLRVYDLGRGYAVSVQSAEQVILIDAGLRSGPHFDSGRDVLVPALHAAGIERIDRLWLTGERGDHQGGLPGVLQGIEVGEVVAAMDCAADRSRWPLGKASEFWLESHATSDPGACVLELRGPQNRWLITGAAPALGLAPPESLRVQDMASAWDGMIFSGHGKSAEQWPLWVAQVQPEQTILVRGRPRRFEAIWPDQPTASARTDASGMIEIRLQAQVEGPATVTRLEWRKHNPQIWRWLPDAF